MSAVSLLDRRIRSIGIVFAFALVFSYLFRNIGWTIDDAFITFRYAENVVRGLGPVYNAGERVEGYTCFSWMTLLAVAGQFGIPIPAFAKAAGMVFVFGSVALLAFWDRVDPAYGRNDALLCAFGLASTSAFVQWGVSGMETSLFCFSAIAVVFTYSQLLRDQDVLTAVPLGLLGTLLTMTRPNGVVLLAVVLVHALLHRRTLSPKLIATFVGVFIVAYGSYFAWRWSYYGYPLPNTFYAKVGSSGAQVNRGIRYILAAMPAFGLLIAPVVCSWGRARTRVSKSESPDTGHLLLALVIVHLSYVIAVGGDNFPAHRFIVVIVPFLWLLAVRVLPLLAPTAVRRALLASVLIGYNFVAHAFDPETRARIARDYVAGDGQTVGLWLSKFTDPDAVIATNSAGALAYYSGRTIVDTLGLNDAEIAHTPMASMGHGKAGHEKGNGFYTLSREPDYVFFGPPKGSGKPMFTGDHQLYDLQKFKHRYRYERVDIDDDTTLHFFRRQSDEELQERARVAEEKKKQNQKKKRAKNRKKARKRGPRKKTPRVAEPERAESTP